MNNDDHINPMQRVTLVQRVLSFGVSSFRRALEFSHVSPQWSNVVHHYSSPVWLAVCFEYADACSSSSLASTTTSSSSKLDPRRAFLRACENGFVWLIRELLVAAEASSSSVTLLLSARDPVRNKTPLHLALSTTAQLYNTEVDAGDRLAVVRCLLEYGADPNEPGAEGKTPLVLAIDAKSAALVEILTSASPTPAEVARRFEPGSLTPLSYAIAHSASFDVIQALVVAGERQRTSNKTANEKEGDSDYLLARGSGATLPLFLAVSKGRNDVAKLLIETSIKYPSLSSSSNKDEDVASKALSRFHLQFASCDSYKRTIIQTAARVGNAEFLRFLVDSAAAAANTTSASFFSDKITQSLLSQILYESNELLLATLPESTFVHNWRSEHSSQRNSTCHQPLWYACALQGSDKTARHDMVDSILTIEEWTRAAHPAAIASSSTSTVTENETSSASASSKPSKEYYHPSLRLANEPAPRPDRWLDTPLMVLLRTDDDPDLLRTLITRGGALVCMQHMFDDYCRRANELISFVSHPWYEEARFAPTPLHTAATLNRTQCLTVILDELESQKVPRIEGIDARLFEADALLRRHGHATPHGKHADVNETPTALFAAVQARAAGAVKLLVERGADLTIKCNKGAELATVEELARSFHAFDMLALLLGKTEEEVRREHAEEEQRQRDSKNQKTGFAAFGGGDATGQQQPPAPVGFAAFGFTAAVPKTRMKKNPLSSSEE